MADLGGVRRALREAVSELDPIVAADKPATLDALARALHALCRAQLALLTRLEEARITGGDGDAHRGSASASASASGSAAPASATQPIPPERLVDDEDEPTVFLTQAEPGGGAIDDDDDDDDATPAPFVARERDRSASGERPAHGEARAASAAHSRIAIERFELEALNRWLASGTLFQMRGDLAYLNLASSMRIGFDFRQKLREMGFARELGLLAADPLAGPVLLFQRP